MRFGGSARLLLALVAVLAAACADSGDPRGGEEPRASGAASRTELVASCGAVEFDDLTPDTSSFTPFTSWGDIDLDDLGSEAAFFEMYTWFTAEEDADSRMLFGEPRQPAHGDNPYASAAMEFRDGAWVPVGWGQCGIELSAPGWGHANFVLDPADPPDPGSDRFTVLATEVACAGGQPPTDRDVRAAILDETAQSVSVVILVEPSRGASDCQGNRPFEFEVQLDSPLGERQVLDASTHPAEIVWPR